MIEKTRTLLFGLFVLAGRPLTAPQCIALAGSVGVTPGNAKSHLTRLVADGALVRRGGAREGVYSISDEKRAGVEAINERLNPPPTENWSGSWLMLSARLPSNRSERDLAAAGLWFDGWRCVRGGAFVRPDWPAPFARASAATHARDGGVWVAGSLSGVAPDEVAALYDLDALDAEGVALSRDLVRRGRARSPQGAFRNRIEAGGALARYLGHDPRLPEDVWGKRAGPDRVIAAWRAFEVANRPLSDCFLNEILGTSNGRKNHS